MAALNLIVLMSALLSAISPAQTSKLTWEEILAKHLESIGSAEARAAVQSRLAEGTVQFGEIIFGTVKIPGTAELLCQGRKTKTALRFGEPQYRGEQLVFDGKASQIATTDPGIRSPLGSFLFEQNEILSEGLLGGTLFTSWPLMDLKERQAKLKYEGLKKVQGRDLYELTYTPKKRTGHGDLLIRLYIEPETFRHIRTVYRLVLSHADGNIKEGTEESTQYLEEKFDDFAVVDGLTLPRHWDLRYRKEPASQPQELQWDVRIRTVKHNVLQ